MSENTSQVQKLYERHPYPHYPLLAKPRWQDGYLGSSLFSHQLIHGYGTDPTKPRNFLSIGSGEILPYILRQWEPSATKLTCVDLSKRSLDRAAFRTALLGRRLDYQCEDINCLLTLEPYRRLEFAHVEAYGVLHHIPSFKTTLNLVRGCLSPDGIVRIMIYNSHARDWIWDINRAFANLGLNFNSDKDVAVARGLLKKLSLLAPRLKQRLEQMGRSSLENNTRFADTFLHPWESRATIKNWFESFESAGLKPVALHDRYAELDDLPNPLWRCPSVDELTDRALDLRFENNLELWLTRKDFKKNHSKTKHQHDSASRIPVRLRLTMPPDRFNKFDETKNLPFGSKLALWHGFLRALYNHEDKTAIQIIKGLDRSTACRLARIGLILPKTAKKAGIYDELFNPLATDMTAPLLPPGLDIEYAGRIETLCGTIQPNPEKALQASKRLIRVI